MIAPANSFVLARKSSFRLASLIFRFPVSKINKLVVAGVAEVFVEPDPFVLIEEGFTGEGPTLNIEQLLLVAIALEHDVALFSDSLNFTESGLKLEDTKVVKRGEGDDEVEGLVLEGV